METLEIVDKYHEHEYFLRYRVHFLHEDFQINNFDKIIYQYCNAIDKEKRIGIIMYFIDFEQFDDFKDFIDSVGTVDFSDNIDLFLKYALSQYYTDNLYKFIKFFLENGANAACDDSICLKLAQSSSTNCKYDTIKLLLEYGANINTDNDYVLRCQCANFIEDLDYIKFLVEQRANIHANNNHAFCISILRGNIDICKYFIDIGANINARNGYPLRHCVREKPHLVQLLLDNGADIKYLMAIDIISCIRDYNTDLLKLLLDYGFDIGILNNIVLSEDVNSFINFLSNNSIDISKAFALVTNGYKKIE